MPNWRERSKPTLPRSVTISCPVCAEPIRKFATVCTHCKADFSWRRYLGMSTTTLALLTALVSVTGTVAPQIAKLFQPNESKISGVFIEASAVKSRTLTLWVSNEGLRPGMVRYLVFKVRMDSRAGNKSGFGVLFPVGGPKILTPGASERIDFAAEAGKMLLSSEPTNPEFTAFLEGLGGKDSVGDSLRHRHISRGTCDMSINVKNPNGTEVSAFPDIKCDELWPLIQAEFTRPN